jgi:tape measure domain-containing protein
MPSARALRFGKAVIELSLLTGDIEKQLNKLQSKMRDFGKGLQSIGTAGLKISGTLTGLLAIPVKLAADFEKTRAEFTAMIGDAAKADAVLSKLQQFALVTPLALGDLSEATRTLLSFGVAVENVVPTLKRLGEIAGGDNERMKRLALAFGQVNAKGRLMAQEVNQMVEAGFNPLQEISRTTGESMKSLMARMEAGGLTVQEVADAFKSATGAGGRFNGLMGKIAGTTIGKFNEMKESIFLAIRPIGDALLPAIKDLLTSVTGMVPKISEWIKNNKELIVTIAKTTVKLGIASIALVAFGTVIGSTGKIIKGLILTIGALRAALTLLASHPLVAVFLAIATATALIAKYFDDARRNAAKLKKELAEGGQGPEGSWMPWSPELSKAREAERRAEESAETPFGAGGGEKKGKGIVGALGGLLSQGLVEAQAAALRAQFEALPFKGMLEKWKAGFEKNIEWAEEAQRLDDEIARERLGGMKDGLKKELALIDLESRIKARELQAAGQLTPEMQAKLDALTEAQRNAARRQDLFGSKQAMDQQATFETRFAGQMFGGTWTENIAKIERHTGKMARRNEPAGIPVL